MNDNIMISVLCITYNQAGYVRKTLEGFVSQKCDYRYEIIVHDDCSQDGTREIIEEFSNEYCHLFKTVFQEENQYSRGIDIITEYLLPLAAGEYLTFCEGDDYWSDEFKLQKQINIMLNHEECSLCVHKVGIINEDGRPSGNTIPGLGLPDGIITAERLLEYELLEHKALIQLSSFFIRTQDYIDYHQEAPDFLKIKNGVGDFPLKLYLLTKGVIYYLADEMSCYRMASIGSWSQRMSNKENYIRVHLGFISMAADYNEYTNYRFDRYLKIYINDLEAMIALKNKKHKQVLRGPEFSEWRARQARGYMIKLWLKSHLMFLYPLYFRLFEKR